MIRCISYEKLGDCPASMLVFRGCRLVVSLYTRNPSGENSEFSFFPKTEIFPAMFSIFGAGWKNGQNFTETVKQSQRLNPLVLRW